MNYKEGHLGNKMTRNEKRSSMVTGKVFWFPPLRRMVIIILKNNDRFNITSIVISDYRIFYDVRNNRLPSRTIYFLIEKTFSKFRMIFMFIIVGNGYVILYLSTTW